MKKQIFYSITLLFVTLTSCKVTKMTKGDYDVMYITKTGIIQRPLVADLDVSKQRLTLTKTYSNVLPTEAKENVVADFIKQNNCDVAIHPFFSTTTASNERSSVTVTISAYTGNFKNMRDFQASDTIYIKVNHSIQNGIERDAPSEATPKKKVLINAAPSKS